MKYKLIFGGKHILELKVGIIDDDYIEELRDSDEEEILSSIMDIEGGELYVYGITRNHCYIKVFECSDTDGDCIEVEEMGDPKYIISPNNLQVEENICEPTPSSLIAAYVNNQDGILGHIDLELEEEFDPKKLILLETSAEKFGGEAAIGAIQYKGTNKVITETIILDDYLDTISKVEIGWISEMDEDKSEVPIYEDSEWVN